MPSRRNQVEMSPDETSSYLRSNSRTILVSNGLGGYPHPMPMNYAVDDYDRIIMTTFRKSQKVLNFRRDPRATLLVETGVDYEQLKSVVIYANTEIIDNPDTVFEVMQTLSETIASEMPRARDLTAQVRASLSKRVILRFKPERYLSWDHTKLAGHY